MMYYSVTEGRARLLDRLNVRDRASYGVDWMVLEGRSARDALHHWRLFKAGTHPRQDELELEVAAYRAQTGGSTVPWEAEADAVGVRARAERARVEARRQELRAADAGLRQTARALDELAQAAAPPASARPARRRPPSRPKASSAAGGRSTRRARSPRGSSRKKTR
jgi:hypothetical protein